MSTDATLTVSEPGDGFAVLRVNGPLDLHTAPHVAERATTELTTHPHLVVDMSLVTFCDSSGLNTLLWLHRHATALGGSFALAAVPAQAKRLLAVTGLEVVLTLYAQPADALPDHTAGA